MTTATDKPQATSAREAAFESWFAQEHDAGDLGWKQSCREIWRAALAASLPQEERTVLGYCLLNSEGKMYWSESCIFDKPGEAERELELLTDDDPDAGWHVAPFCAAAPAAPKEGE